MPRCANTNAVLLKLHFCDTVCVLILTSCWKKSSFPIFAITTQHQTHFCEEFPQPCEVWFPSHIASDTELSNFHMYSLEKLLDNHWYCQVFEINTLQFHPNMIFIQIPQSRALYIAHDLGRAMGCCFFEFKVLCWCAAFKSCSYKHLFICETCCKETKLLHFQMQPTCPIAPNLWPY